MKNILITGGNGFIASHLVDALATFGNRVTVFDLYPRNFGNLPEGVSIIQGNLQDANLIRRTLEDNHIDLVYHAAWSNIHETALKDPLGDIQTNVINSINLFNACLDTRVKKVIFFSSGGTVYGNPNVIPIPESHSTNPINAYGITKLMVEKYLHMYYYLYGLQYSIIRPSVPFGPRQNPFRHQGAVSVFIYKALKGETITIFGDGEVKRDFFYIDDLIGALLSIKDFQFDPKITTFNIGGDYVYSINDLVKMIEKTLNKKLDVKYEAGRKFDVPYILLDTNLAKAKLHWRPIVSMEEGIKKTANWFETWMKLN